MDDIGDTELAILETAIKAAPKLAEWIGGLLSGEDKAPSFTVRARDILPQKSESEKAAEILAAEMKT